MRLLGLCLIIFGLVGCSSYNAGYSDSMAAPRYDPYADSGIDELLAFGASMANMSPTERTDLCKSLLNTQKLSPSDGKQLHLMVGRLLSDACGDIPKIIEGVHQISPSYASDERVQRLIAIHTEALMRIQNQTKKTSAGEKPKKSRASSEPKESKDAQEPQKDEARLLREKLEAIRSIEKQMDESVGGK